MFMRKRIALFLLASLFYLIGCGSDGASNIDDKTNHNPIAVAGDDQTVASNTLVRLDGSDSSDQDGDKLSFHWVLTAQPVGSSATLDSNNDTTSKLTVDEVGVYTITLTVSDEYGGNDTDQVLVRVIEQGVDIPDSDKFLTFVETISEVGAQEENQENEQKANLYYAAIDPAGRKDTLEKWYIENCFEEGTGDSGDPPNCGGDVGDHAFAVYLNNVDLNLGRRMRLRSNPASVPGSAYNPLADTVASCVENYGNPQDEAETAQEKINKARDGKQADRIATVCMEYGSPHTNTSGEKFTKFYTFGQDGERITKVDLDGRGAKYQPDVCLVCHGGKPGKVEMDLSNQLRYSDEGDTKSGFIPWDLSNFKFSQAHAELSQSAQQEEFRKLNEAALLTYKAFDPDPATEEGAQAVRELVRGWYDSTGNTIPVGSTFNGDFTPTDWSARYNLYHQVVAPSCRACHVQRGLENNGAIDFSSFEDFKTYHNFDNPGDDPDSINRFVYEEGTMPLALRTYELFWDRLKMDNQAEAFWTELGFSGDVGVPGKPIAKISSIDISDIEATKTVLLDGRGSLFSESYLWELVESPTGAQFSLQGSTSAQAKLVIENSLAEAAGDYKFRLTTTNSSSNDSSVTPDRSVTISDPGNTALTYRNNVSAIFSSKCASCHQPGGSGAGSLNLTTDTNSEAAYNAVIAKINLTSPAGSLLLTKNDGTLSHTGGTLLPKDNDPDEDNEYDTILQWIEQGADF